MSPKQADLSHEPSWTRQTIAQSAFAGFCFPSDVIVLAVRWYLRFGLSYRDVEELLAERGFEVRASSCQNREPGTGNQLVAGGVASGMSGVALWGSGRRGGRP